MTRERWTKSSATPASPATAAIAMDKRAVKPAVVDKHLLYELSVQSPRSEIDTLLMFYRQLWHEQSSSGLWPSEEDRISNADNSASDVDDDLNNDRPLPTRLREDFCGTAVVCAEFASRSPLNDAYGVDYDRSTIEHATQRLSMQPEGGQRVHLYCDNVFTCSPTLTPRCDIVCALNYGVFYCHTRNQLVEYLRRSRQSLRPPAGLFICDVFGGSLCYQEGKGKSSRRPLRAVDNEGSPVDFVYHFEQRSFDASTNRARCFIHFEFPRERSWIRQAFSYDFRIYTVLEVREAMAEAGFRKSYVWVSQKSQRKSADGSDKNDEEGLMTYRRLKDGGEHWPGVDQYNAYIVGCL